MAEFSNPSLKAIINHFGLATDRGSGLPGTIGSRLLLLEFFTPTCGMCRMIKPRLHALASKYPMLDFVQLDATNGEKKFGDTDKFSSGDLAQSYAITEAPTLILYYGDGVMKKGSTTPVYRASKMQISLGALEDIIKHIIEHGPVDSDSTRASN